MSSLPWDDFRLVRAIAEHRSLGGAAQALGVNNSTVFRRLNSLEETLGVRMFERARSGYLLTSAGEEMVALAGRLQDSILDFERRIAGQDVRPSGELRVTTTDTMFSHLVAPMFCAFRQKYPEITLDFVIENRILNLSRRDADVAIRATAEPPETLVGRRVATLGWGTYAADGLMAEMGLKPGEGSGSANVRWIGYGDPMTLTAGGRWLSAHIPGERMVAKVNTMSAMASAVTAGLGIGLMPCFIGEHLPGVQRVERIKLGVDSGIWVLTHPDLKKAARVRAFLEFFGGELTKKRKLIEGEF
jgi:DNA-binding transcriptional LysR family regulator